MLDDLKKDVLAANKELVKRNLVIYSWGNVSAIDRDKDIIVIKPAGYPYAEMTVDDLSVVDMDGNIIAGPHKPAVDLPTHLVLYRSFKEVNAIVHTHSTYATMWAQSGKPIPPMGTTHADYFLGEVPCTRALKEEEVAGQYEQETGNVIVDALTAKDPLQVPGVLTFQHGPFTWGEDVWEAVHKSVVLEELAQMALGTLLINPDVLPIPDYLANHHYFRKHGAGAYFGVDDKLGKQVS